MIKSKSFNSNFIIFIMMLGTFSILSTELGFVGILPQVAQYFSIGIDDAGLFISCFSAIIAVGSLIVPIVVSRFNRRHLFIVVLAIMSIFSFAGGLTDNFYVALACRIVTAIFYPAYISIAFTVAGEIAQPSDAPRAISKIVMGISAGTIFGVPLCTFFANHGGYPMAMFWFGFLNLAICILTVLFFPSIEGHEDVNLKSQFLSAKSGIFLISTLAVVVFSTGFCGFYNYASSFIQLVTGIVGGNVTVTLLIAGIMSIFGSWTAGRMLSSEGSSCFVICSVVCMCVNFILFYVFASNYLVVILLMAILGFLDGIFNNLIQYWIFSAIPQAPEFANGVFMSMLNVGITVATILSSRVIDKVGIIGIIPVCVCILVVAIVLFAYRMRRYPTNDTS